MNLPYYRPRRLRHNGLLRQAIAERTTRYNRVATDADRNVTVCCGATKTDGSTSVRSSPRSVARPRCGSRWPRSHAR